MSFDNILYHFKTKIEDYNSKLDDRNHLVNKWNRANDHLTPKSPLPSMDVNDINRFEILKQRCGYHPESKIFKGIITCNHKEFRFSYFNGSISDNSDLELSYSDFSEITDYSSDDDSSDDDSSDDDSSDDDSSDDDSSDDE